MEHAPTVKFLRLQPDRNGDIPLPCYMTPGASGMDVCAAIEKDLTLQHGKIALIPTGFAVSIPEGFEAQMQIVENLDETDRNAGGFGHTGL